VYAPVRGTAEALIVQAAVFPKGKRNDLSTTRISYLRAAWTDEKARAEENEAVMMHSARRFKRSALYPC